MRLPYRVLDAPENARTTNEFSPTKDNYVFCTEKDESTYKRIALAFLPSCYILKLVRETDLIPDYDTVRLYNAQYNNIANKDNVESQYQYMKPTLEDYLLRCVKDKLDRVLHICDMTIQFSNTVTDNIEVTEDFKLNAPKYLEQTEVFKSWIKMLQLDFESIMGPVSNHYTMVTGMDNFITKMDDSITNMQLTVCCNLPFNRQLDIDTLNSLFKLVLCVSHIGSDYTGFNKIKLLKAYAKGLEVLLSLIHNIKPPFVCQNYKTVTPNMYMYSERFVRGTDWTSIMDEKSCEHLPTKSFYEETLKTFNGMSNASALCLDPTIEYRFINDTPNKSSTSLASVYWLGLNLLRLHGMYNLK